MTDSQMLTANDLDVRARLAKPGSKVKAYADVSIPLGLAGAVKLCGFLVVLRDAGEQLAVIPPSAKGKEKYFDKVELVGKIRPLVEGAILAEYQRLARPAPQSE